MYQAVNPRISRHVGIHLHDNAIGRLHPLPDKVGIESAAAVTVFIRQRRLKHKDIHFDIPVFQQVSYFEIITGIYHGTSLIYRFSGRGGDKKRLVNKIIFILLFQIIFTPGTETMHDLHTVKRSRIVYKRSDQTLRPGRNAAY